MLYPPMLTENRVMNGDLVIDQRNEFNAVTPAATSYVCDGWKFITTGLGSDLTFQVQPTIAPLNFLNAMKVVTAVAATPTTGQNALLALPIEGSIISDFSWGTVQAKQMILMFQVYSTTFSTFAISVQNSAGNRSYVSTFTAPQVNAWIQYQITISGDIAGTWLTGDGQIGALISFDLGSGASFQTTANTWAAGNFTSTSTSLATVKTLGAVLYIANMQIRQGPNTDTATYISRPKPLELELCRRYFQKTFQLGTVPAQNAGITGAITVKNPIALGDPSEWWQFTSPMAKTPTIITYNPSAANANWRDITAAADVTVSVDPASTIGVNGVLIATSGTVSTLGDILAVHATADAGL